MFDYLKLIQCVVYSIREIEVLRDVHETEAMIDCLGLELTLVSHQLAHRFRLAIRFRHKVAGSFISEIIYFCS